jgi:hypothetical protein
MCSLYSALAVCSDHKGYETDNPCCCDPPEMRSAHLWDVDLSSYLVAGVLYLEAWEAAHGHALVHDGERTSYQRLRVASAVKPSV